MASYEQTLIATEGFLRRMGIEFWANWLRQDLDAWRDAHDVSHHRTAYGGMGSFNDVVICIGNGHSVTKEQEPFTNELLDWLRSLLYCQSQNPDKIFAANELAKHVGRHTATLAAFVGGDHAPTTMHGLFSDAPQLNGWRCTHCGHTRIDNQNIDTLIARQVIPPLLFQGCQDQNLSEVINNVLDLKIPQLAVMRSQLREAAKSAQIVVTENEGWLWNCPQCGQKTSSVCRWDIQVGTSLHLKLEKNAPSLHSASSVSATDQPLTSHRKPWWRFW